MPIKDKSLYPKDWPEIRKRILEREGHCCKTCKVKNGVYVFRGVWESEEVFQTADAKVFRLYDGEFLTENPWACIEPSTGDPAQVAVKIVLTVAHLDNDPANNHESNLAALCQLHHLRHDARQHKANAAQTRKQKKGLQELF
jgi:hypothetical protein